MENTNNIVWHVPIQIMSQIGSTYTIPENQAHLERLKEDMQKVLMCYSQYANLMRPLDNTLYCNRIGQAYNNAREGLPLFVSGWRSNMILSHGTIVFVSISSRLTGIQTLEIIRIYR